MVRGCEEVLWAQNTEYIKSMQEALERSDLEKEASLVNRVIKELVESAERSKEDDERQRGGSLHRKRWQKPKRNVEETFKAAVGSLAEEASSELVQQELEAMSKAVSETGVKTCNGTRFKAHILPARDRSGICPRRYWQRYSQGRIERHSCPLSKDR